MKRNSSFILAIASGLVLSGCIFNLDDGSKEYQTPELFMSHVVTHHGITILSSEVEEDALDYELKVKDAILSAAPFESVTTFQPTTERHVSYKFLRSHSTAGPNYANMYIYSDGALRIDYKAALASEKSFYFTINPEKAANLNDFVGKRIVEIKETLKSAKQQAKESAGIASFVDAMKTLKDIPMIVRDPSTKNGYDCFDDGTVCDLIQATSHTPIEQAPQGDRALIFNYSSYVNSQYSGWQYFISGDYKNAGITKTYKNPYGDEDDVALYYAISEADGRKIFERAFELWNQAKQESKQ